MVNKKDVEKMARIMTRPLLNLIDNRISILRMLPEYLNVSDKNVKTKAELIYFNRINNEKKD